VKVEVVFYLNKLVLNFNEHSYPNNMNSNNLNWDHFTDTKLESLSIQSSLSFISLFVLTSVSIDIIWKWYTCWELKTLAIWAGSNRLIVITPTSVVCVSIWILSALWSYHYKCNLKLLDEWFLCMFINTVLSHNKQYEYFFRLNSASVLRFITAHASFVFTTNFECY
jgi:hypothetical protein